MNHPDWSSVVWHIYHSPQGYRILPRTLTHGKPIKGERATPKRKQRVQGEHRPDEVLCATVKRCSLKTVRALLKEGITPIYIQAKVDAYAADQAERCKPTPNGYHAFLERVKRQGEADALAAAA